MSRKFIKIELSILDSDVIMNQLFCNLGGIEILKEKRGGASNPYEIRLKKAVRAMAEQVELTEEEETQADLLIIAHNSLLDKDRQN